MCCICKCVCVRPFNGRTNEFSMKMTLVTHMAKSHLQWLMERGSVVGEGALLKCHCSWHWQASLSLSLSLTARGKCNQYASFMCARCEGNSGCRERHVNFIESTTTTTTTNQMQHCSCLNYTYLRDNAALLSLSRCKKLKAGFIFQQCWLATQFPLPSLCSSNNMCHKKRTAAI